MLPAIIRASRAPAGSEGLLAEALPFLFLGSHCFLAVSFALPPSPRARPEAVGVPLSATVTYSSGVRHHSAVICLKSLFSQPPFDIHILYFTMTLVVCTMNNTP